ncbi:MAG: hypothetical protein JSV91_13390 [Phycisphaerales bacterium]|nr:MAG: hypothetical protein JSV91_13390 [Phycisphaerales bacterium]
MPIGLSTNVLTVCAASLFALAGGIQSTSAAEIHVYEGDSIQAAIDDASEGDEIIVHQGTYTENLDLLGKAIILRSTDPTDPDVVASTIIDGGAITTVVTCASGEGLDTVLSGFVITNGDDHDEENGGGMSNRDSSPTVSYCTFTANNSIWGGGMRNLNASPNVSHCTFDQNTAGTGGGMISQNGNPTVTHCTFTNNSVGGSGGGMVNAGGSIEVSDCTFTGNSAASGGGMQNYAGTLTVSDCTFSNNSANAGGGIHNYEASPIITRCTFIGNTGEASGGGMQNHEASSPEVVNCLFTGNTTSFFGSAICVYNSESTIINSTFSGNDVDAMYFINSQVTVANCILWNNDLYEIGESNSSVTVSYSNVQGGYSGEGNIDADPAFADAGSGNYRLSAGSPCIDAADNNAVPAWVTTDLDGEQRFVDDPDTDDTGLGDPPLVDMGAYEYQPPDPCPADLNNDGVVNIDDLFEVLAQWGPCA